MKNLLLSLTIVLICGTAAAQLYVAPNTSSSTDSYIYVDDQVLYVEQDINLVENTNDPTTEASIYLRNDAQLMQGGTTSTNTGDGFISIYQESSGDAYDYTYWCSPISNSVGTGNKWFGKSMFHDEVTLTDSNQALFTTGYNGSSSPLTISTRWFYKWAPSVQRWHTANTGVPPGYGFIMKGTDVTVHGNPLADPNIQRYDFRGRPNNGDIQLPIQVGVPFTDGNIYNYTLAGNPYPSALNLYDVFWDPSNTEIDSFKFWDEDRSINSHYYIDNKGGYGTWLPGANNTDPGFYTVPTFWSYDQSGASTGGSTGSGASFERLNAPVGQGFMIMANVIGDGTIWIRNSHRLYMKEGAGNNSEFRNPNSGDASATAGGTQGANTNPPSQIPHIRVQTFFGENSHMRDMILAFRPESTDGYDRGMDASHPMDGAKADAYFKIGNTADTFMNLVIQTVPFADDKQVPIAFTLEEETKFFVTITQENNTPFQLAYLYDSELGSYQEITNGRLAVQTLSTGTYEDRFYITFRGNFNDRNQNDPIVDAQNELLEAVDFLQNNRIATLEVSNPEGYDVKAVNIFDMNGKLVLSQENLGTQTRLAFPTANFADGVYLVKLTTTDNFAIDYKITVFNK